jgi:hypothetical protein
VVAAANGLHRDLLGATESQEGKIANEFLRAHVESEGIVLEQALTGMLRTLKMSTPKGLSFAASISDTSAYDS